MNKEILDRAEAAGEISPVERAAIERLHTLALDTEIGRRDYDGLTEAQAKQLLHSGIDLQSDQAVTVGYKVSGPRLRTSALGKRVLADLVTKQPELAKGIPAFRPLILTAAEMAELRAVLIAESIATNAECDALLASLEQVTEVRRVGDKREARFAAGALAGVPYMPNSIPDADFAESWSRIRGG